MAENKTAKKTPVGTPAGREQELKKPSSVTGAGETSVSRDQEPTQQGQAKDRGPNDKRKANK